MLPWILLESFRFFTGWLYILFHSFVFCSEHKYWSIKSDSKMTCSINMKDWTDLMHKLWDENKSVKCIISSSSSNNEVGYSACESMCHLASELRKRGECLVLVMQDGNEFAMLCCSQAILEQLTSENAGPSRKIRSFTRAGQCLL